MAKRGVLLLAWALLGTVASYGLLYAFSPVGIAILATCFFAGLALAGGRRRPEILGLAAGPPLLILVAILAA